MTNLYDADKHRAGSTLPWERIHGEQMPDKFFPKADRRLAQDINEGVRSSWWYFLDREPWTVVLTQAQDNVIVTVFRDSQSGVRSAYQLRHDMLNGEQ